MSPARAEWFVKLTMKVLAANFAVVGALFVLTPDGVLGTLDDLGDAIGSFSPSADTDQRFWLGLGFAYMVVITGLCLVVAADPVRHRPLLLVLAAGKAASSLSTGIFYLDDDSFPLLLNFLVDGGLAVLALWCYALTGRIRSAAPG